MQKNVGKIEKVPLREIWKNEATEFTPWLFDNMEYLSDVLGFDIFPVEREKSVGPFSVDIVAENSSNDTIIVECQLEKTNHDHLGKLLVYLTNLDAKIAIWITSNPRPEHINVITWLNEITPADVYFFLIKIEAVKIENSKPAPLFSIVTGPSREAKEAGEKRKDLAERHIKRLEFWEQLLSKLKEKSNLFANISPRKGSWISTSSGKKGIRFSYVVNKDSARVEVVFDSSDERKNKEKFNKLLEHKSEIEKIFGEKLIWDILEDRKTAIIRWRYDEAGWRDENKWDEIQGRMIDAMLRLEKATKRYIKEL